MYRGVQIIAEVKTRSPFVYRSEKTWDELFQVSEKIGDIISIHKEVPTMGSNQTEREVLRCKVCGLVQYRTKTGSCRRCVKKLPQRIEDVLRLVMGYAPETTTAPTLPYGLKINEKIPDTDSEAYRLAWTARHSMSQNKEIVERIGLRVRELRESEGLTQSQLEARAKVSRSYLSRIEAGLMTPSLGTVEKIGGALGIGIDRFFRVPTRMELIVEDAFVMKLKPFLRSLDGNQWEHIAKVIHCQAQNVPQSN